MYISSIKTRAEIADLFADTAIQDVYSPLACQNTIIHISMVVPLGFGKF